MSHVAGPAHLGDVDQALDSLLQLDERPVVRDRHDPSADPAADRILGSNVLPRIRHQLLQAERNALAVPIDIEDLHLEFLADVRNLRRVPDPAPRHVGDMQQAVHSSQIDEGAEVRDVLHYARSNLTDLQFCLQQVALVGALRLEDHPPGNDDVPAPLVELQDHEVVFVSDQIIDVRYAAESDL